MRARLRGESFGIETVAERRRNLGRALENIENFLGLVGFVALFLGAIGVASTIHVYVRQKIATVAVLRCLGASRRMTVGLHAVQLGALGLVAGVAGCLVGFAAQWALGA